MTIGVVKPGGGRVRHGGFRSGGRNLFRGGASKPFRHGARPIGAGHAFHLGNRITRQGNFTGKKYFGGVGRLFTGRPITIREVQVYFNAYLILKKTFDAELRFLDRMGAYIRADANKSMKSGRVARVDNPKLGRVKGQRIPSTPPSPPRAWQPKPYLKKFNYWFVDPMKYNVIVGPVLLPGSKSAKPVPGLHEHGRSTTIKTSRLSWRGRKRVRKPTGTKRVNYPARPYMFPALQKNLRKVRELRNSI